MQFPKVSRRRLLTAMLALGTSRMLAACAAQPTFADEPSAVEPTTATRAIVPLRFMLTAEPEQIASAQRVLDAEFSAEAADIQVTVEAPPTDWAAKLEALMLAGEAPDLIASGSGNFFRWLEGDLVLDVQPFVERDLTAAEVADFYEYAWRGLWVRGKRIGLPRYVNLVTVCVNVDIFEQYNIDLPPADGNWTYEDYANLAAELTEAARVAGNEVFWGGWKPMWSWGTFWTTIHLLGGKVVNEPYGKQCLLDTPESQAALQWAYDLIWSNNDWAQAAQVKNQAGHDALAAQLIGYAEEGLYPVRAGRKFAESNVRWELRHVPLSSTGTRKTLGTTDAWLITRQTPHPEAAWQVVRFLAGPIYQEQQVIAQEGVIPARKSLLPAALTTLHQMEPSLAHVRLETVEEALTWGYAEDIFWFHKQMAAYKIIDPALKKVFRDGSAGPELFREVAQQVNVAQQW